MYASVKPQNGKNEKMNAHRIEFENLRTLVDVRFSPNGSPTLIKLALAEKIQGIHHKFQLEQRFEILNNKALPIDNCSREVEKKCFDLILALENASEGYIQSA